MPWWIGWALMLMSVLTVPLVAAEISAAEELLRKGEYRAAIDVAQAVIATEHLTNNYSPDKDRLEGWSRVLATGLLTVGRYAEAYPVMTNALRRVPRSVRLRWLARDVFRANGEPERGMKMVDEIREQVAGRNSSVRDGASLVVFGRALLLLGADPKDVLEKVYAVAQKVEPKLREVYLARGELALDKHEPDLAAKAFNEGLKIFPEDPDLLCGLAEAHVGGDRTEMIASLEAALKVNPRHLPSLQLLVDHRIDAEDYSGAGRMLDEIEKVNPADPDGRAYRAVLAFLRNDVAAMSEAREAALGLWITNPRVDHLIGLKLSQRYRFAEGAAHQRQALALDPDYLPAKSQLASDLLRLGEEAEGWRLAEEVQARDGYDVAAFNLGTLHATMSRYATITNGDFILRMTDHEAAVYGPRVLDLLNRAKHRLSDKYGFQLTLPTIVEVFANQKDFGVRTFGMPENPGFLGVCFGRVVTANSPAANGGHSVNWEAVLWHEFCHVITLQLTRNRMPRWLSEGISVYEEAQENPTWGQRMTPRYREMILGGELIPIARLSSAFLTPKTPFHLQFAYFESSLVVEFLIERYGLDRLRAILHGLRDGVEINGAIVTNAGPLEKVERDFAEFAGNRARQLGPGLSWEKPALEGLLGKTPTRVAPLKGPVSSPAGSSTNYYSLLRESAGFVNEKKWSEAREPLQRLLELYPDQRGGDSAYAMLAAACRGMGDTNEERRVLTRWVALDGEAADACLRLMELSAASGDWGVAKEAAGRFLAINPLTAPPYRFLSDAAEKTGDRPMAVAAYRSWLKLDPPNPAEVHFRLARVLHEAGDAAARREVLLALEEAPRNRAALDLLLKITAATGAQP
ncbi:MAG: tetratricopeptide repeat protein [Pedosphaera sp.]|nr:tetratricopeptide repeat protein [Pedosphaera sp.]